MVRRYTRALELEVARLRTENRALLNSILGIAGIPPITVEMTDAADVDHRREEEPASPESGLDRAGGGRVKRGRNGNGGQGLSTSFGLPLRRRTWLQANRALEIDAARKKAAEANAVPELGTAVKNA